MFYSLDAREVKKVIDKVLAGKPYDEKQFMYYHLNRNYFNVQNEIKTLKKVDEGKYIDNLSHVWTEISTLKNYFHMPFGNWAGSTLGITTAYSRKFVRDDYISGLEGEFEMIIRQDGKRIDALVNAKYQETYNFGRTRLFTPHKKLDVDPHNKNPNYTIRRDTGIVLITESDEASDSTK
ncbi:hypothetical protein GCM10028807_37960 [Spirosoma daeguense]